MYSRSQKKVNVPFPFRSVQRYLPFPFRCVPIPCLLKDGACTLDKTVNSVPFRCRSTRGVKRLTQGVECGQFMTHPSANNADQETKSVACVFPRGSHNVKSDSAPTASIIFHWTSWAKGLGVKIECVLPPCHDVSGHCDRVEPVPYYASIYSVSIIYIWRNHNAGMVITICLYDYLPIVNAIAKVYAITVLVRAWTNGEFPSSNVRLMLQHERWVC